MKQSKQPPITFSYNRKLYQLPDFSLPLQSNFLLHSTRDFTYAVPLRRRGHNYMGQIPAPHLNAGIKVERKLGAERNSAISVFSTLSKGYMGRHVENM